MSDANESRMTCVGSIPHQRTITREQADAAQARFDALWVEFEANRTYPPSPFDYYTYKGLWQRAFGAEQVVVVG